MIVYSIFAIINVVAFCLTVKLWGLSHKQVYNYRVHYMNIQALVMSGIFLESFYWYEDA